MKKLIQTLFLWVALAPGFLAQRGEAESGRRTLHVPADYPSIQAAIDAARPGELILVQPGTYRERIELKTGAIVKSAGDDTKGELGLKRAEATIIDGTGGDNKKPGVLMAEDSVLDGFTVTGIGEYDDALWTSHHATQGNQQSHEHIGEPGVAGISVDGIGHCQVLNNIVHHIGYTGIAVRGEKNKRVAPQILRNITYRNMGGGIGSMNHATGIIAENTCFENFYAGIGHDNSSPLVINNRCYANIRAGIGVSEHSKPVVRGNRCYRNRRAGIGIRTGKDTRPIIEDNDCYRNDMAGIGTEEHASPIIRGNRCYENAMAGIGATERSHPLITGNQCYRNAQSGIGSRDGAEPIIIDNQCHENKLAGIGFDAGESGTAIVMNNRVINNALVAVGIQSGWKVTLTGNELSREGGLPPIVMVSKGAEAFFSDNTIKGEGVAGIRTAGIVKATGNRFKALKMRKTGPPSFAIWALEGSSVTMEGNEIATYRNALNANGATVNAINNTVSDFFRHAFVIKDSPKPANVFNNIIHHEAPDIEAVLIEGPTGIVSGNEIRPVKE